MATERNCEVCGSAFTAQRSTAKYCSGKCSVQATRARKSGGAKRPQAVPPAADGWEDPEPPPRWGDDLPPPMDERPQRGDQEQAVWLELEAVGRTATSLGVASLILARRIDNAATETGGALAGLIKELRSTVAAATATASGEVSRTDEVRAQREKREREAREARRGV